ncbi:MAG TPA: PD-(D/E)XK nuclease family protein [Dehalococcoidia bacterium]|nr:PD-(D/E)XK nuclease family protein [Dehalococcoidia bacterium]
MIDRLSFSAVETYLKCPRMFEYRYLWKMPRPVGGGLIQGKAYHAALAAALVQKLHTGQSLPLEETLDAYCHSFEQAILKESDEELGPISGVDWGERKPGEWKDQGIALVKLYYQEHLPGLEPYLIEQRLETSVDGIPVVGYVDLVLKDGRTIDHKVVARTWAEEDAHKDLQPSFYALLQRRPIDFEFHLAINTKEPRLSVVATRRDEQAILWTEDLIRKVWALMQTGVYPGNPVGYWCSPKFCGHQDLCKREFKVH